MLFGDFLTRVAANTGLTVDNDLDQRELELLDQTQRLPGFAGENLRVAAEVRGANIRRKPAQFVNVARVNARPRNLPQLVQHILCHRLCLLTENGWRFEITDAHAG